MEDPATVNIQENIISEQAGSNLGPKKTFDTRLAKVAGNNPDSVVKSTHVPLRREGETRPFAVTHWITIDGEKVYGVTIFNPKE